MTKIEHLIRSCFENNIKNVLLFNIQEYDTFKKLLQNDKTIVSHNFNTFDTYDTIIMNQSDTDEFLESLYKKFLSNIIIIDNISNNVSINDREYWTQLKKIYALLNNNYNAICIALNEYEYINSNYAHNFYINIKDTNVWENII